MSIIPENLPPGFIYFDLEGAKKKARQALLDLIAWAGYRTRLARVLNTHEQNVYQWCRRGEISRPWALRIDAREDIPFTKEQLRPDVLDWEEVNLEKLPEPVPYNKPENPEQTGKGVRAVRDWYKPRTPRPKAPKVKRVKKPKPPKVKKPKPPKRRRVKVPKKRGVKLADMKLTDKRSSPASIRRARKAAALAKAAEKEAARLKALETTERDLQANTAEQDTQSSPV